MDGLWGRYALLLAARNADCAYNGATAGGVTREDLARRMEVKGWWRRERCWWCSLQADDLRGQVHFFDFGCGKHSPQMPGLKSREYRRAARFFKTPRCMDASLLLAQARPLQHLPLSRLTLADVAPGLPAVLGAPQLQPGTLTEVCGPAGAGKTLLCAALAALHAVNDSDRPVLYVCSFAGFPARATAATARRLLEARAAREGSGVAGRSLEAGVNKALQAIIVHHAFDAPTLLAVLKGALAQALGEEEEENGVDEEGEGERGGGSGAAAGVPAVDGTVNEADVGTEGSDVTSASGGSILVRAAASKPLVSRPPLAAFAMPPMPDVLPAAAPVLPSLIVVDCITPLIGSVLGGMKTASGPAYAGEVNRLLHALGSAARAPVLITNNVVAVGAGVGGGSSTFGVPWKPALGVSWAAVPDTRLLLLPSGAGLPPFLAPSQPAVAVTAATSAGDSGVPVVRGPAAQRAPTLPVGPATHGAVAASQAGLGARTRVEVSVPAQAGGGGEGGGEPLLPLLPGTVAVLVKSKTRVSKPGGKRGGKGTGKEPAMLPLHSPPCFL